jgi:hypothetical protein
MTKNNKKMLVVFLGLMMLLPSFAFASDAPTAIGKFIQFSIDLVSGKVGILAIMLIMVISAVLAWKNASYTPLIYGLIASTLIGAAASIGASFADFNLTGYGE